MGVDIGFYIQKNVNNKWEDIFLYKPDDDKVFARVEIWRCGRDLLNDIISHSIFGLHINHNDIKDLAEKVEWIDEDDELPPYYAITLSKLKYLANKPDIDTHDTEEEYIDKQQFYKDLVNEIEVYLRFTDNDYIDEDNIRIIAFVSY